MSGALDPFLSETLTVFENVTVTLWLLSEIRQDYPLNPIFRNLADQTQFFEVRDRMAQAGTRFRCELT